MRCPRCGLETKVIDSREAEGSRWRRRKCHCGNIIETREDVVTNQIYRRMRCLADDRHPHRPEDPYAVIGK